MKKTIAICYDFDKTLSPTDMQAQGFIQDIGFNVEDFWKKADSLAVENQMDSNLAYMYLMVKCASGKIKLDKNALTEYGKKIEFFNGVTDWFNRICEFGTENGVTVEHYIISSGLKEIIDGTPIAKEFKRIYASSFMCDNDGTLLWPSQVVNFTNKTQFLFRISKGDLDVNSDKVNDKYAYEDFRIPFKNMLYLGDSATDVPCMKLLSTYGGYSVGVYNPQLKNSATVEKMKKDGRISYYAAADYSLGGELDTLVKSIITNIVSEKNGGENK